MKVLLVAVCCVLVGLARSQGAGRAIPIATENFVIDLFRNINPRIKYDTTNFLVDLSGNYANCNFIGRREHGSVTRRTPNGVSIASVQDYADGSDTHTQAVDNYLRPVFESWVFNDAVRGAYGQIQAADTFGCSVRPGCNGQLSVACLFSPYRDFDSEVNDPIGEQNAMAFTKEQYSEAEFLTDQTWDRSHFLENLSGYETRCDMINRPGHNFAYSTEEARSRRREVVGLYDWARNRGSTPDALNIILENMKQINSKEVGCSLIADCSYNSELYVVVSCIFEI